MLKVKRIYNFLYDILRTTDRIRFLDILYYC